MADEKDPKKLPYAGSLSISGVTIDGTNVTIRGAYSGIALADLHYVVVNVVNELAETVFGKAVGEGPGKWVVVIAKVKFIATNRHRFTIFSVPNQVSSSIPFTV